MKKRIHAVTLADSATFGDLSLLFRLQEGKIISGWSHCIGNQPAPAGGVIAFPELGIAYLELDPEEAARLRGRGGILQVRPTRPMYARDPGSPVCLVETPREIPWNIRMVQADAVWARATGAGVKVGILDTGIDRNHPDLPVVDGVCTVPSITDWDDAEMGHGTQCAGIVGARRNGSGVVGVAPDCELHAIRVTRGGRSEEPWMVAGLLWAARQKLDVVSVSIWDSGGDEEPEAQPWAELSKAAAYCLAHGCAVIGISGNSGDEPDPSVTYPARAEEIIAVGAVGRDGRWASLSSYGPDDLPETRGVEIVAPGEEILSTSRAGGYAGNLRGTSFACPHVTGAYALVKQLHPDWSPAEIRRHLKRTAADIAPSGRDAKTGFGLLDCLKAVS